MDGFSPIHTGKKLRMLNGKPQVKKVLKRANIDTRIIAKVLHSTGN